MGLLYFCISRQGNLHIVKTKYISTEETGTANWMQNQFAEKILWEGEQANQPDRNNIGHLTASLLAGRLSWVSTQESI